MGGTANGKFHENILFFLKPSLKGIADTRIKDLINHMSGLGKQGRMIKLVDIR